MGDDFYGNYQREYTEVLQSSSFCLRSGSLLSAPTLTMEQILPKIVTSQSGPELTSATRL